MCTPFVGEPSSNKREGAAHRKRGLTASVYYHPFPPLAPTEQRQRDQWGTKQIFESDVHSLIGFIKLCDHEKVLSFSVLLLLLSLLYIIWGLL